MLGVREPCNSLKNTFEHFNQTNGMIIKLHVFNMILNLAIAFDSDC